jgi:ferritin
MIGTKMQQALNKQITAELHSSYLYLAMAAHFEADNWRGLAHWMRLQAKEEHEHAMKIFDHVLERGGRVTLEAIDAPPGKWTTPLSVFQAVHAHEIKVTGLIHALAELAAQESDHAAGVFLQWFVNEQVEEEAAAALIVEKLKRIGDSTNGLFMLDHELGERGAD